MNQEAFIHMLLAMRAQIDAGLAMLGVTTEEQCTHPKSERLEMSTMGHEHWQCKACGYEFDDKKEA